MIKYFTFYFCTDLNSTDIMILQELSISGPGNRLSAKTVIRITSSCPDLKWLGDLRDWNIGQNERQILFKDVGCSVSSMYGNWEPKDIEPKLHNSEIITALNDGFISIADIYEVIRAPGFML